MFRIKSPGQGVYSLKMNYGTFFRGGEGSVYILNKNTTDIVSALIPDNRVGKVSFYNPNTTPSTDVIGGSSAVLGSWNFGTDSEYIMVLHCSAPAPIYSTMGYMYPTSVTFTQGVLTPTVPDQNVNSVLLADKAITTFEPATYAAAGLINGQAHIYIPIEGKRLFVYNVETGEKYDDVATRFTVCRGITVDPDGKVWMVGSQYYLQCYDPYTRTIKEYSTKGAMESGFDLVYGDNGCLYFGSYPNANVYEFNIATETLRNLGAFNADAAYSCSIAYDPAGFVYAALSGNKNSDDPLTNEVVKIDIKTGFCVGRTDISDCVNPKSMMVRGGAVSGNIYLAGGIEMDKMVAINTTTMEQTPLTYNGTVITNPINFSVSGEHNGKHYFVLATNGYNYKDNGDGTYSGNKGSVQRGLYSIDDETGVVQLETTKVSNSLRLGQTSFVPVNGEDCIFWQSGGNFYYTIMSSENTISLKNLVSSTDGTSVTMNSITTGAPGSNEILLGAFNNDKCSVYDIASGTIDSNFYTNGQTDSMIVYNGELYAGNYKGGILVKVNREDKSKNEVLMDFRNSLDPEGNPFSQVRVPALAAGGNKVFVGTIPDSYLRGACIGWYDTVTGETYIERNVVENQSISSLTYHDGYLYGTTTTSGGTGTSDDTPLSAKLFIYDVANKKKVAEIDLRNEINGLPGQLSHVSSIVTDPNVATNGKLWGIVSEVVFSLTFNKKTGSYTVNEEAVISKTKFAGAGRKILFSGDYMYAYFGGTNLFCKFKYSDLSQRSYLPIVDPAGYVIGEDNNLYYYNDSNFYMYPLNVTSGDKTAANAVDSLITALYPVTVSSKTSVEAARLAYNNLTCEQKSLVRYQYLLDEAEVDLLEARIDAVDLENPDQTEVDELLGIYSGMTDLQQSYATNFNRLLQASEILTQEAYAIDSVIYCTLTAALKGAYQGAEIKLLMNRQEGDVVLTNNVTLDLNGFSLTCDSIDSAALGYGDVIDSSGGKGLLVTTDLLLKENNRHMLLWDATAEGYRLFAYTFVVDPVSERITVGTRKFWYRLTFESAEAYTLIAKGQTGLEMGAALYWDDEYLLSAVFGRGEPLRADTFSAQWATQMQSDPDSTWLFVSVSGMDNWELNGTLIVEPLVKANGIRAFATNGESNSISYKCSRIDYGYTERIK